MWCAVKICVILLLKIVQVLSASHPLDPLTSEEIHTTVQVIKLSRPAITQSGRWVYNLITLKEPEKSLLLPYFLNDVEPPYNSKEIPRRSLTILRERERNVVNEVVVNLNTEKVESWKGTKLGTETGYTVEETERAIEVAKNDTHVQKGCRRLGWENLEHVVGEVWSLPVKDNMVYGSAVRPLQVYLYGKHSEGDNHLAHPLDFVTIVDLAYDKVIAIENLPYYSEHDTMFKNHSKITLQKQEANFNRDHTLQQDDLRNDISPIYSIQPGGPSYRIKGNEVSWQKFKFLVGYSGKEGVIIHHVSYHEGNRSRPLFYRMSLAELAVQCGDPRPPFHQKFSLGISEFNIGYSAINLRDTDICRGGVAHYQDAYLNNEKGESVLYPGVLCIHEEEAGLLWGKYTKERKLIQRQSQRLIITYFIHHGNYDYKISWRFYQDASIEFNTELLGSPQTTLFNSGKFGNENEFGNVVSQHLQGQFDQHFLSVRLDPEIDGNINTVSTFDIVPIINERAGNGQTKNPYGNGFTTKEQQLRTPKEARTLHSPLSGRTWLIKNPGRKNNVTKNPVSWKIIPYNAPLPFLRPGSFLHRRGSFMDYNVWVTKYNEEQFYPSGFYLNSSGGLAQWVRDDPNADLTSADIVVWYNYGFIDMPRTEDFPILATKQSGFILQPFNFFLKNPSLGVPPTPPSSQQRPPPPPPSALASEAPRCKETNKLPYFKL